MNFLQLSQAPPELEEEIAIWTPETMTPARYPETAFGPNTIPSMIGVKMTMIPGMIISYKLETVEISMHLAWSSSFIFPEFLSLICLATSVHYKIY